MGREGKGISETRRPATAWFWEVSERKCGVGSLMYGTKSLSYVKVKCWVESEDFHSPGSVTFIPGACEKISVN